MPLRKQVLATNEVYHVFNRGVASSPIFNGVRDYKRFLELIYFYRFSEANISFSRYLDLSSDLRQEYLTKLENESKKLLEIYSYCLMPNHFHFLIKQLVDDGIKTTFAKVQNAYAKYFNLKNKRFGPLFQSRFKAKLIERDENLLHVSRYIHLNPCTSFLIEPCELTNYSWSSYPEYLSRRNKSFVNTDFILKFFSKPEKYKKFVLDQADYQRKLGEVKHLLLE